MFVDPRLTFHVCHSCRVVVGPLRLVADSGSSTPGSPRHDADEQALSDQDRTQEPILT
jgi:hypothetical protein